MKPHPAPRRAPLKRLGPLLATLAALLAGAGSAEAYTLVEDGDLTLQLDAWGRAGYALGTPPGGELDHAHYVTFARLSGKAEWKTWGGLFLQYEGASRNVDLLDLIATINPTEQLTFRMGKFKIPTSMDFLLPGHVIPFANRAMLVGLVPLRHLGVEVEGRATLYGKQATLQLGWFEPTLNELSRLPDEQGYYASARAALALDEALTLHLAWVDLVLANNAPRQALNPLGEPARPIPLDQRVDVAVTYIKDNTTVFVEGLASFDAEDEVTPLAGYVHAFHTFGLEGTDGHALEPGARYGLVRRDGGVTHRATLGLTYYIRGVRLFARTNYEVTVAPEALGHLATVQLQGGF